MWGEQASRFPGLHLLKKKPQLHLTYLSMWLSTCLPSCLLGAMPVFLSVCCFSVCSSLCVASAVSHLFPLWRVIKLANLTLSSSPLSPLSPSLSVFLFLFLLSLQCNTAVPSLASRLVLHAYFSSPITCLSHLSPSLSYFLSLHRGTLSSPSLCHKLFQSFSSCLSVFEGDTLTLSADLKRKHYRLFVSPAIKTPS